MLHPAQKVAFAVDTPTSPQITSALTTWGYESQARKMPERNKQASSSQRKESDGDRSLKLTEAVNSE